MSQRLKILLVVLAGLVLLANLLNLFVGGVPQATPPASAKEIKDIMRSSTRRI